MSIYFGNQKIAEIYHGNVKIKEVYKGSSLVYQSQSELILFEEKKVNLGFEALDSGAIVFSDFIGIAGYGQVQTTNTFNFGDYSELLIESDFTISIQVSLVNSNGTFYKSIGTYFAAEGSSGTRQTRTRVIPAGVVGDKKLSIQGQGEVPTPTYIFKISLR